MIKEFFSSVLLAVVYQNCATRKFSQAKFSQLPNFECSNGKGILVLEGSKQENLRKGDIVKTKTKVFENGNTFVQFNEYLEGCVAEVLVPSVLTTNDLMELLIKTRTAKSVGAASITIRFETMVSKTKVVSNNKQDIPLPIQSLFSAAGATHKIESNSALSSFDRIEIAEFAPSRKKAFFSKATYPEFAEKLAGELCLAPVQVSPVSNSAIQDGKALVVMSQASPVNENFFLALSESNRLMKIGYFVHMHMPYLPYARSDKIDQEGIAVTGRLIADLIESAGSKEVSFVRAHAPQSQGFFGVRSIQISGRQTVNSYLKEKQVGVVVSPDAGFQKDATLYANELNVPVSVANKQRSADGTSKLVGFSGEEFIKGKIAAIIDDETASGGTLVSNAKILKNFGAEKIYAVVTHVSGAASAVVKDFESNDGVITEMVATNTIPFDLKPGMKVLSVISEVAGVLAPTFGGGCAKDSSTAN
jgi:ribose-phosphate pyrophosphokinase